MTHSLDPFDTVNARRAADDRLTHPADLEALVASEDWLVQVFLAKNPSTPSSALAILARKHGKFVRFWTSANLHTPPEALEALADDADKEVARNVAANPSASGNVLGSLAEHEAWTVRLGVAANPSTSPEVLAGLSNDANSLVRWQVVNNPNTPISVVKLRMEQDADPLVKIRARTLWTSRVPARPWGLTGREKFLGRYLSTWAILVLALMAFASWWLSYTSACEEACAATNMESVSMRGFFPDRCACLGANGNLKVLELP